MHVNERIARALHPELCFYGDCWLIRGDNEWHEFAVPDYAHSLDACLHVLAALREKGWRFVLTDKLDGESWCCHGGRTKGFFAGMEQGEADVCNAPSLAAALAECLADALETEKC